MDKGRLEAFSDGVLAIVITVMVLEIHAPEGETVRDLTSLAVPVLVYFITFLVIGTYWNNHHHLLQAADVVNGRVLWSNLLFLFVISLMPVSISWSNHTRFATVPTALYAALNLAVSLSYMLLEKTIIRAQSEENILRTVINGRKEKITLLFECAALALSFLYPVHGLAYVSILAGYLGWLIPDLRISRNTGE